MAKERGTYIVLGVAKEDLEEVNKRLQEAFVDIKLFKGGGRRLWQGASSGIVSYHTKKIDILPFEAGEVDFANDQIVVLTRDESLDIAKRRADIARERRTLGFDFPEGQEQRP